MASSTSNKQLKILVVDDDEMNRRMMRLILTREDHQIELASDGYEACDLAASQRFDIILMDLQMPEMGGVETSRRIRALEKGSKDSYIVALTASYLPEKGSELFEAGIDNYIAKPFDVEHLRQILSYGLDHRATISDKDVLSVEEYEIANIQSFNPAIGIKQVGGDSDTFRELLSDFIVGLPQKINILEKRLVEKDMEGLSRDAHNLKGVLANLGLLQLSQYAGRLENSASGGYTEFLRNEITEIRKISENFIHDATIFLSK
jgi:CheY-like chemotaxis protein